MTQYNNSITHIELQCKHCGSFFYEERPHDLHGAGAWCNDCGRFIKWLGKARTSEEIAARDEKKRMYLHEYLAGQDPTKPQVTYLNKLGYKGYVGSRLHASNIINERVNQHEHDKCSTGISD